MSERSNSTGGIVSNSPITRSSTSSDGWTVKLITAQLDGTNCLEWFNTNISTYGPDCVRVNATCRKVSYPVYAKAEHQNVFKDFGVQ